MFAEQHRLAAGLEEVSKYLFLQQLSVCVSGACRCCFLFAMYDLPVAEPRLSFRQLRLYWRTVLILSDSQGSFYIPEYSGARQQEPWRLLWRIG